MALALPFDISLSFLSGSVNNYLGTALGLGIIFGLLYIWVHLGQKGEHKREAKAEKRASGMFSRLGAAETLGEDEQKKDSTAEQVAFKDVKKDVNEEKRAAKGKEKKADAAEGKAEAAIATDESDEAKIEEDIQEIERETTAVVAEAQELRTEIHTEIQHELDITTVEQREVVTLEALESRIGNISSFGVVNQEAAKFLYEYFQQLGEHTAKEVEYEKGRETSRHNVVVVCRDIIVNMQKISNFAKKEVRNLVKVEKRERRHFNKELKTLRSALRRKKIQIEVEAAKGNKADPALLAQLKQEFTMLTKNEATLVIVRDQLKKTHILLDAEVDQLKDSMQSVVKSVRSEKKKDRALEKRQHKLPKTVTNLEKAQAKLHENIDELNGSTRLHGAALQLSVKLKNYFDHYLELLHGDQEFIVLLEALLRVILELERKLESLTPLIESILESSEALENGTAALVNILATMLSNDVSNEIREAATDIQLEVAILEKQKNLVRALEAIEKEIENGLLQDEVMITSLKTNVTKLIAENQELYKQESTHLANTMATALAAKEAMTTSYEKTTTNFAEALKDRNAVAGEAFERARRAA